MMSCMSNLSRVNFMKFRTLTSVLSELDDFKTLKLIYLEWFWVASMRNCTKFDLYLGCQKRSNGFEWARWNLQNFDLDLICRGWWVWFHLFDLSGLSHCFIYKSRISSGAAVVVVWLEVVTLSQTTSSRAFKLVRMRVMNSPIRLS